MLNQNNRLSGVLCAVMLLGGVLAGCGDDAGNKAVRDEVQKATATTASSGTGAYGKVAGDTALPPQGKRPEPGTDYSARGKAASSSSAPQ